MVGLAYSYYGLQTWPLPFLFSLFVFSLLSLDLPTNPPRVSQLQEGRLHLRQQLPRASPAKAVYLLPDRPATLTLGVCYNIGYCRCYRLLIFFLALNCLFSLFLFYFFYLFITPQRQAVSSNSNTLFCCGFYLGYRLPVSGYSSTDTLDKCIIAITCMSNPLSCFTSTDIHFVTSP